MLHIISFYFSLSVEHHSNNCCSQFKLSNNEGDHALENLQ